jgi:thiol-disulfide isomerase/thioredoxin
MIDTVKKHVSGMFGNTNRMTGIITIALIALFVFLAIWFYRKYVIPSLEEDGYKENNEYRGNTTGGIVNLYYFYTEWCPHCKKARPVWNEFKEGYGVNGNNIGSYNGMEIMFHEVDCDKEKSLADKFGIKSFPTIKMVYRGTTYEYDARPDVATLRKFVETYVR